MADKLYRPGSWNASSEERAMRAAVAEWAHRRWPGCRVLFEVPVGQTRIDVLVVTKTEIVGVEIKSSLDTLGRLARQLDEYLACIPEVWVAMAPKWWRAVTAPPKVGGHVDLPWRVGRLTVEDGALRETHPLPNGMEVAKAPNPDLMLTSGTLHLLRRDELICLADLSGIKLKSRETVPAICGKLARRLTGDGVVSGVARILIGRP